MIMKKITILILFGSLFAFNINAQFYLGPQFHRIQRDGPIHPLSFKMIRSTDVDSMSVQNYYRPEGTIWGNGYYTKLTEKRSYSEDGLRDTIRYSNEENVFSIFYFSEDSKLLCIESGYDSESVFSSPESYLSYNKYLYSYDDEGRMIKDISYVGKTYPGGRTEVEFEETRNYDYSTIRMTEKGYIYGEFNMEYELDSIGRVTLIKYADEDKLVELNGVKYFYNSNNIIYTDSSVTSLGYYYRDDMMLGAPDIWSKGVYVYNEEGYLKSYTHTGSLDGIEWITTAYDEYRYTYITTSSKSTTDNAQIEKISKSKVYGVNDAIKVIVESGATARIYNIYGQLIKQQQVSTGENNISVSKGLYIVTVGDDSFKVFVK